MKDVFTSQSPTGENTSANWVKKKGNYQITDRRSGTNLTPLLLLEDYPFNLRGVKIMPVGDI